MVINFILFLTFRKYWIDMQMYSDRYIKKMFKTCFENKIKMFHFTKYMEV